MINLHDKGVEYDLKIHLPFWSEVIGILNSFHFDYDILQVVIDNKILTLTDFNAKYFQDQLDVKLIGHKIGVLRTDISDMPFLIHQVN